MTEMEKAFITMMEKVLKDDNGISEDAYSHLAFMRDSFLGSPGFQKEIENLCHQTDATDGRYYIKE